MTLVRPTWPIGTRLGRAARLPVCIRGIRPLSTVQSRPRRQTPVLDISETRRLLGYEPQYSLRHLLQELVQYGPAGPPA
ncbi:MAG: NAD(P)-dependent oxidoreductase [Chloroflexi bacterium]|nr:NAD(P)-dependent oxidoreductase [Chloroflexota bacterium]